MENKIGVERRKGILCFWK